MICRFCGSRELVWDHSLGLVVCTSCGSVLEDIIDDSPRPQNVIIARRRAFHRAGGVGRVPGNTPRFEITSRLALVNSAANSKALAVLSRYHVARLALSLVDGSPTLKARTTRARVAIALYLIYRALGYSKTRSRILASRACRVSAKTLEVVEKRNKRILSDLELKTRDMVSSLANKGDVRVPFVS